MSWQLSNEVYDKMGDHFRRFYVLQNGNVQDCSVTYFYDGNQGGVQQSYPSLRNNFQELIAKAATLRTHRKHQERAPPTSMMHQCGSNYEWVSGKNRISS